MWIPDEARTPKRHLRRGVFKPWYLALYCCGPQPSWSHAHTDIFILTQANHLRRVLSWQASLKLLQLQCCGVPRENKGAQMRRSVDSSEPREVRSSSDSPEVIIGIVILHFVLSTRGSVCYNSVTIESPVCFPSRWGRFHYVVPFVIWIAVISQTWLYSKYLLVLCLMVLTTP